MDETKFDGVTKINDHEFELHKAHCFKIDVPQIGSAQAIYYDVAALKACCEHIKKNSHSASDCLHYGLPYWTFCESFLSGNP